MVGWHHRLTGQEFEQTKGDSEGQGSLAWHSSRGHESDMTEQQQQNMARSDLQPLGYGNSWKDKKNCSN